MCRKKNGQLGGINLRTLLQFLEIMKSGTRNKLVLHMLGYMREFWNLESRIGISFKVEPTVKDILPDQVFLQLTRKMYTIIYYIGKLYYLILSIRKLMEIALYEFAQNFEMGVTCGYLLMFI